MVIAEPYLLFITPTISEPNAIVFCISPAAGIISLPVTYIDPPIYLNGLEEFYLSPPEQVKLA